MNPFIIGSNGQLGRALCAHFPHSQHADNDTLDITEKSQLDAIDWSKITHIINAAAYTNVDGSETPEGRKIAWQVNAIGAAHVAAIAQEHNLTIVHISTDYVFDGQQAPHSETEPFSPLGVYGQSKAAGDIAVSLVPQHYILRTSWVIGDGKNFVRTMLDLAKKDINPTVVADQIGRPTFTSELVRAIDHVTTKQTPYGTYNVSNSGDSVSWADFTREIFQQAALQNTVTDITTDKYYEGKTGIAPRPLLSTLSLEKLAATGFESKDWHEDLKAYLKREKSV